MVLDEATSALPLPAERMVYERCPAVGKCGKRTVGGVFQAIGWLSGKVLVDWSVGLRRCGKVEWKVEGVQVWLID